jgi:hypothetical protein
VVLLEGEDLGELFLTKLGKLWRRARSQEYPKPASAYEEFDDSGRSERCL